eukprot:scaffold1774_cov121-Isochrysis_galbana.AAC.8
MGRAPGPSSASSSAGPKAAAPAKSVWKWRLRKVLRLGPSAARAGELGEPGRISARSLTYAMAVAARAMTAGSPDSMAARSGVNPSPRNTSALVVGLSAQLRTMPIALATSRHRWATVASGPIARTHTGTPLASSDSEVRSCRMLTADISTPASSSASRLSGP